MRRIRLARAARSDIAGILRLSEEQFGTEGRSRYKALLDRAILDLSEAPSRAGVQPIDSIRAGYRTYHIKWAETRVTKPTVKQPRHLMVFSTDEQGDVVIAAVVHERETLQRHLDQ